MLSVYSILFRFFYLFLGFHYSFPFMKLYQEREEEREKVHMKIIRKEKNFLLIEMYESV